MESKRNQLPFVQWPLEVKLMTGKQRTSEESSEINTQGSSSESTTEQSYLGVASPSATESGTKSKAWAASSTSKESSSKSSTQIDFDKNSVPVSSQEQNKAEADGSIRCVTQHSLSDELIMFKPNSLPEKMSSLMDVWL